MAKVELKFPTLDGIKNSTKLKKEVFKKLANYLPQQIVKNLKAGQSSIEGKGRLIDYKNPKKYPGKIKSERPVNLYLSGDLHKSIDAISKGNRLIVGPTGDSEEISDYLQAGKRPLAGPRRYLPTKSREEFTDKIQRGMIDIVTDAVARFIKKTSR